MLNLEIDVAAAKHNIGLIRSYTSAEICAVIKANCYGLGLPLAKHIEDSVDSFSVSSVSEYIEAKNSGINKNIYILGIINPIDFEAVDDAIYTVSSLADIEFLNKASKPFKIALKLNSGMNRLGAPLDQVDFLINEISKCSNLHLDSIFTHFYDADAGSHVHQSQLFIDATKSLNLKKHCCASNCLKVARSYHLDMVRCGLAIYGYGHKDLKPSLKAYSTVSQINHVKKGEHVGYGNFTLEHDAKIAIIRTGYADGYRRLYKKHYASAEGKLLPIIGQISMDMMAVDITETNVKQNDKIYLIDEIVTADMLAKANDTIVYEILTAFNGSRIKRIYKGY